MRYKDTIKTATFTDGRNNVNVKEYYSSSMAGSIPVTIKLNLEDRLLI